ncbi:MAG: type II secretion system protein GspE [Lentisphaerae bacterium]|nr:type II secretion system protein GspE [Lentisphaerota bacterium]
MDINDPQNTEVLFCSELSGITGKLNELKRALPELIAEYPEVLAECGGDYSKADAAVLERGLCTEIELLKLYTKVFGLEVPDEDALPLPERYPGISNEYLSENGMVPASWDGDTMQVYVSNPYQLARNIYVVERQLKKSMSFILVRRAWLERIITSVYKESEEPAVLEGDSEDALRSMAGEARIVRMVNDIFSRAIELSASDIHVEPGEDHVVVRCRVDGVLTEILSTPIRDFPAIASRIKLIAGLNIAESRLPQDGRTTFQLGRTELDMRVSTIPILTGESIVLRLLNKASVAYDLRALGLSQAMLNDFNELIQIPHGMILVVGPTGSGKTTTLYSVINQLNDSKRKIITVEDPVEYQLPGLCQMQVNSQIGVDFASGLRSIVRQDPDVILVGEIRDRETADIAINAALTGHLVLSTLHTNDAVGAVTRLIDMNVEGFLVASALFGVMSQRLVRKVCTVCNGSGKDVLSGGRCRNCNGSGFRGRTGIYEFLRVNDELREAISHNQPSSVLEKIAVKNGMKTLLEDGRDKVAQGITTAEELLRSTAEG